MIELTLVIYCIINFWIVFLIYRYIFSISVVSHKIY